MAAGDDMITGTDVMQQNAAQHQPQKLQNQQHNMYHQRLDYGSSRPGSTSTTTRQYGMNQLQQQPQPSFYRQQLPVNTSDNGNSGVRPLYMSPINQQQEQQKQQQQQQQRLQQRQRLQQQQLQNQHRPGGGMAMSALSAG